MIESHYFGIEVDPGVHFAPAHVAHHVVDELQAAVGGLKRALERYVSRHKGTSVVFALHKYVHGIAVGFDSG